MNGTKYASKPWKKSTPRMNNMNCYLYLRNCGLSILKPSRKVLSTYLEPLLSSSRIVCYRSSRLCLLRHQGSYLLWLFNWVYYLLYRSGKESTGANTIQSSYFSLRSDRERRAYGIHTAWFCPNHERHSNPPSCTLGRPSAKTHSRRCFSYDARDSQNGA